MFGLDQPLPKPKFSPHPQLLVDVMNQLFFFFCLLADDSVMVFSADWVKSVGVKAIDLSDNPRVLLTDS